MRKALSANVQRPLDDATFVTARGGLEMKAALVDLDGKVIRERTKIVIPSGEITELENNKTARVPITISGFTKEDEKSKIEGGQAKLKMEVTAVKFK